ncbi:MAG: AsmA family protein [candidate division Zixibacteria bacterium]
MGEDKSKKTKGRGCLSKLIIFLLLVILILFLAGEFLFPEETVRKEIVDRASTALNRQVELDNVSFSLFPWPSLKLGGLRIYNPENFPGAEFISIDELECGLKILPLFQKRLEFTEITLEHPVIRLRKAADGRVNYRFDIDTGEEPISTPMGDKTKLKSEEAAMMTFAFDWAEINHGDITFQDDSANTKTSLNNINLETRLNLEGDGKKGRSIGTLTIPSIASDIIPEGVPLNMEFTYNADIDFQNGDLALQESRLTLNGIPFDIEATVRNMFDPISIFARIKADNVSIDPLIKYLPSSENFDKDMLRINGRLSGDVESRIELKTKRSPYFSGQFKFNDLTVGYGNIAGRAHFKTLTLDFDSDSISFYSAGGTLSDNPCDISGKVKNWDDIIYELAVKGKYNLVGLQPFLDEKLNHELIGTADLDIKAAGKKSDWINTNFLGTAQIENLYYNNDSLTSPLEKLNMKLTFGRKNVTVDTLYAEYPGASVSLTGTLKNGFAHLIEPRKGHKKPYLDYELYSPLINYDILVPEEEASPAVSQSPDEGSSSSGQSTVSPSDQQAISASAPIFLPDISASGKTNIDRFIFREMEFSNISGDVEYDEGLITFTNTAGNIYSGNIKASGTVDITDMYQPLITSEFTAEAVETNEFLSQFTKIKNHLFGKVNAKGQIAGRGSEPQDFIKSLNAQANANIKDGKIINFPVINKLAEKTGFKTFEEESIRNLTTDLVIRDGKMLLDDMKLFSRIGDWDINGTIAVDNYDMDMQVSLYLSEQYSGKANLLGDLLRDENGRIRVNFNLGGTYLNPTLSKFSTDQNVVKKKVEDKLKKGVKDLFNNLIKKK